LNQFAAPLEERSSFKFILSLMVCGQIEPFIREYLVWSDPSMSLWTNEYNYSRYLIVKMCQWAEINVLTGCHWDVHNTEQCERFDYFFLFMNLGKNAWWTMSSLFSKIKKINLFFFGLKWIRSCRQCDKLTDGS